MPPFQHICSLLAWTPLPLRNEPRYFFNSSDDPCVKDPAKCTANLQASTQAGLLCLRLLLADRPADGVRLPTHHWQAVYDNVMLPTAELDRRNECAPEA